METKNIGMGIKLPEKTCQDSKCPFHGSLKLRGRTFTGTVIAARMQRTATVEWMRQAKIQKYERYARKRSRLKAHNPDCLKAEEGDVVKIMECRPLSKTVNFCIVEKMGKERGFMQRRESLEASKKGAGKEKKEETKQGEGENKEAKGTQE
jgi:small subunit ribosomal protein S17